jgi:hypothetical protein
MAEPVLGRVVPAIREVAPRAWDLARLWSREVLLDRNGRHRGVGEFVRE